MLLKNLEEITLAINPSEATDSNVNDGDKEESSNCKLCDLRANCKESRKTHTEGTLQNSTA